MIYIRSQYAERVKLLSSSWVDANRDRDKNKQKETLGRAKGRWGIKRALGLFAKILAILLPHYSGLLTIIRIPMNQSGCHGFCDVRVLNLAQLGGGLNIMSKRLKLMGNQAFFVMFNVCGI